MAAVAFLAALAVLASSPAAASAQAAKTVGAFRTLCSDADASPADIRDRAQALGWRTSGPDLPPAFDPAVQRLSPGDGSLTLQALRETSLGEQRDTCGVSSRLAAPNLTAAVQAWIGFAPATVLGTSANFFAVRDPTGWRDGGHLDHDTFLKAKAEGRFYSFVVMDNGPPNAAGYAATLLRLRVKPAP